MIPQLHVLVVEDSQDDAELMMLALRDGGLEPEWRRVDTAEELTAALAAGKWDAVLSDYTMPEFGAQRALELIRAIDPDLPFIVVSGTVGEEVAVEVVRAGANDYVLKKNLIRLAPALDREIREAANRRVRRAAEQLSQDVLDSLSAHVAVLNAAGTIIRVNVAWDRFTEANSANHLISCGIGANYLDVCERATGLHSDEAKAAGTGILAVLQGKELSFTLEYPCHSPTEKRWFVLHATPLKPMGRGAVVSHTNISERRRSEEAMTLFRVLIDHTIDGIEVIDPATGRFLDVNQSACVTHGYTREEYLSKCLSDIYPIVAARTYQSMVAAGDLSGSQTFESLHRRKDGTTFPVEINFTNIRLDRDYLVGVVRDITERKSAAKKLESSQLHFARVLASSPAVLYTLTIDGARILGINWISDNLQELLGYAPEEAFAPNWWMGNIDPISRDLVISLTHEELFSRGHATHEYRFRHRDGLYRWIRSEVRMIRDSSGRSVEAVGSMSDITERKRLEDQFHQSQKMEAFGQLAGGVAHDFNNLLTIINGYSELLLQNLPARDPSRDMIAEIFKAGERSAGLTSQLLAFSRQSMLAPRVLDLNAVVSATDKMLRRLIGEDIRLTTTLDSKLWSVRADPGQIEQVLMNLAVNARDAMPRGGRLTIETRNSVLDESYTQSHPDVRPGRYVAVSVTDTGSGISPEILGRIFEPFFTTKGLGKGTGLGLATVYGIVKQSGGHVSVYSEVGIGTSFKMYLPRIDNSADDSVIRTRNQTAPRGTETILLAEDEAAVRTLTRLILITLGYSVIEASDGVEAVRLATEYDGTIHLLLTDVVMPGKGGRLVAEDVVARHPEAKVLFISGYTDDAVIRHGVLREGVNFLQKPFTQVALAFKVRELLDAPAKN